MDAGQRPSTRVVTQKKKWWAKSSLDWPPWVYLHERLSLGRKADIRRVKVPTSIFKLIKSILRSSKMSFGFSVGDFLLLGQLCWNVYKKCKDSTGIYAELTGDVSSFRSVVQETEELLSEQALTDLQKAKLLSCQKGCEAVLKDLDALLVKYESLGTRSQRTFDRMRMGREDLNGIRQRLILNGQLLDSFIAT